MVEHSNQMTRQQTLDYDAIADDMWMALGVDNGGYDSDVDQDLILIVKALCKEHLFMTALASKLNLPQKYVILIQTILCSANWCNYGTSPRGCWIDYDVDKQLLIASLDIYSQKQWGLTFDLP